MEYFNDVLDRSTGELVTVSTGHWITVTELGQLYGFGPRRTRTVLRHLDVLQVEGAANHQRHRLSRWVVDQGIGKRIDKRGKVPFDVIGPDLRLWIAERWEEAVAAVDRDRTKDAHQAASGLSEYRSQTKRDLTVSQCISWLAFHFPDLTQDDVGAVLSVTRQLVSKYHRIRDVRLRALKVFKAADPDDLMAEHRLNQPVPQLDYAPRMNCST